jgi:hypothetical protein
MTLAIKVRWLNFANIFISMSFICGNDSSLDNTTRMTKQTYWNKKGKYKFLNILYKDLFAFRKSKKNVELAPCPAVALVIYKKLTELGQQLLAFACYLFTCICF